MGEGQNRNKMGARIALRIDIGTAIWVAIGNIAIGIAVGVALGATWENQAHKGNNNQDEE